MTKFQMLRAVSQALILSACSDIIYHYLITNALHEAQSNELWMNMTKSLELLDANQKGNMTITSTASNGTTIYNATIPRKNNGTKAFDMQVENKNFYWKEFPLGLFYSLFFLPLLYYWHILLERMFPSRRRLVPTIAEKEGLAAGEFSEAREMALVQRLMAQGKIKRSSLSWRNTFLKWFVNLTVGQIWAAGIAMPLLEGLVQRSSIQTIYREIKWGMLWRPWLPLFSFYPLGSLLSLIIVPAHKRIVFVEGIELLWSIFSGTFLGVIIPWLSTTHIAKNIVETVTLQAQREVASSAMAQVEAQRTRLPDEL